MKYPRALKLDGSISKINFDRIVELLKGLRDSESDVAVPTVPEAWIPTEEFRKSQFNNEQLQRATLAQAYQL
eukprot:2320876-Karenia_brevis.AAC.1